MGSIELSGIEKFEVWFGSIGGSAVIDWSDMLEDTVHYLTDLGHNIGNCEWMLTRNKKIIK